MRRIIGFLLMTLLVSSILFPVNASGAKKAKKVVVVSNPEYIKCVVENALQGIPGIKVYDEKRTPSRTKIDYIIKAKILFCRINTDYSYSRCNPMEKADVAVQIKVICANNGRIYDSVVGEASASAPRWQNRNVKFESIMEAIHATIASIRWVDLTN
ncbi:MAG: hypothetical protein U9P88_00715 [Patescibacteria group bacterium]|nr:hypothetical protein [Patescibacteria group bacterium]